MNKMWYIYYNGILFSLKKEGNYDTFYNMDAGFPGGSLVKNPPANAGATGDMGSIPGLVFLQGKSYGQRSLVGYSTWGHKDLDMT